MVLSKHISVLSKSPELKIQAEQLAVQLRLPLLQQRDDSDFFIEVTADCVQLVAADKALSPVYVDFSAGKANHRRLFGGGEAIARACGIKKNMRPRVLDATAGLGGDAFVLASLGCEVTLLEREPVIAALLADGLQRAAQDSAIADIAQRMRLQVTDALEYLCEASHCFDVIYLDPMFPGRKKSAAVKKEMQLFQAIAAPSDEVVLLAQAIACAGKRVVVKRPVKAAPLADKTPDFVIKGRSCRFDCYNAGADYVTDID